MALTPCGLSLWRPTPIVGVGRFVYGAAMTTIDLLVRKNQLSTTEIRHSDDTPLTHGDIRVRIDTFALTANNITYAAFGDAMQYWSFFPVNPPDDANWGRIPVWGFGSVTESQHPDVNVGEKLYGYYPMSSSVVLTPTRGSPSGFDDGAPHRAGLHAVYNRYLRCNADPFYTSDTEDTQALLRPLFVTSWLIDDFLADNAYFGAAVAGGPPVVLLLSSASSKTAYGTAFQMAQREGIEVVGLTSEANVAFCESLGCYHRVLTYAQLDKIQADAPCVYVDFAGNAGLRLAIHTRFTHLAYSCAIGGTHVMQLGSGKDVPGPKATLFFAPAQIKKRSAEWGANALGQRLVSAWRAFVATTSNPEAPWMTVDYHQGPAAVEAAYAQVLAGGNDPRLGFILSLN